MVDLYLNEKPRFEIIREYDLTPSALDRWINQSKTSGSFEHKDNLTKDNFKGCTIYLGDKRLEPYDYIIQNEHNEVSERYRDKCTEL